jgi:hypothetical protein
MVVVGANAQLLLGFSFEGAAYSFAKPQGGWNSTPQNPLHETGKLIASDGAGGDGFGWSEAISGTEVVVGAPGLAAAAAYIFAPTATITLTSGPDPAEYGSPVILKAKVTAPGPMPTGTVTFLNYGAMLGMVPLHDGVAEFAVSTLPVGTNKLTARYSGDQNYPAATSSAVIEIVKTSQTNSFPPLSGK